MGWCEVGNMLLERVQLIPDAESRESHDVVQVVVQVACDDYCEVFVNGVNVGAL